MSERGKAGCSDSRSFPPNTPVKRIVFVGRWLRDEDIMGLVAVYEVMVSNVRHDLRARKDFDMELLLDIVELLKRRQQSK